MKEFLSFKFRLTARTPRTRRASCKSPTPIQEHLGVGHEVLQCFLKNMRVIGHIAWHKYVHIRTSNCGLKLTQASN